MVANFSSSSFFKICSEEIQAFAKLHEPVEFVSQKFPLPNGEAEDYFTKRTQITKTSLTALESFATLEVSDDLFKQNRKHAIKWIDLLSSGVKMGALQGPAVHAVVQHFHKIFQFKPGEIPADMTLTVKNLHDIPFSSAFFYNPYVDAFNGAIVWVDIEKEVGEALTRYPYQNDVTITSPVHLVQLFNAARRLDNLALMKKCVEKYKTGSVDEKAWLEALVEAYELRGSAPEAAEQKLIQALMYREDFLTYAALSSICKDPEPALKMALKLNPTDPFLNFEMGKLLFKRRKVSAQEDRFSKEKLKNLEETHLRTALKRISLPDLMLKVGKLELKKGNWKVAQELFEKLIRKSPESSYRSLHARSLLMQRQYETAEELMMSLYHREKDHSAVLSGLLLSALIHKSDLAGGRSLLEIFQLSDKERDHIFKEVLKSLILLKQPKKIVKLYQMLSSDQQENAQVRSRFINFLMHQAEKEIVQPKYYLELAYQIDPSSPDLLNALASLAQKEGKYEEAVTYLLQLAYETKDVAEKKRYYERAVTLLPKSVDALNGLAQIAIEEEKMDEALNRMAQSLTACRKQPKLCGDYVRRVMGDSIFTEHVLEFFEKWDFIEVLERERKKEHPNYQAAVMELLLQGDVEALNDAEILDPKSKEVKNRLARIAFDLGDVYTEQLKLRQSLTIDTSQIFQRADFVRLQVKEESLRSRMLITLSELEPDEIRMLILYRSFSQPQQVADALITMATHALADRAEILYPIAVGYATDKESALNDWADFRQRHGRSVVDLYLQSLQIQPNQPIVRNRLIEKLFPDNASTVIQVVRRFDPCSQKELFAEIEKNGAAALLSYLLARKRFDLAFKVAPKSPDVINGLSQDGSEETLFLALEMDSEQESQMARLLDLLFDSEVARELHLQYKAQDKNGKEAFVKRLKQGALPEDILVDFAGNAKEPDSQRRLYTLALECNPDATRFLNALGDLEWQAGNIPLARKYYFESLERDPMQQRICERLFSGQTLFLDEVFAHIPRRWERRKLIAQLQIESDPQIALVHFIRARGTPAELLEIAEKLAPGTNVYQTDEEYIKMLFDSIEKHCHQFEVQKMLSILRACFDREGLLTSLRNESQKDEPFYVECVVTWLLSQESDFLDPRVSDLDDSCNTLNALAKRALTRNKKGEALCYWQESLKKNTNQFDVAREFIKEKVAPSDFALVETICEFLPKLNDGERKKIFASNMDPAALVRTLVSMGDDTGWEMFYGIALEVNPDDVATLNLLATKFKSEESIPLLFHSLEIRPNQPRQRAKLVNLLLPEEEIHELIEILDLLRPVEALIILVEFYSFKNLLGAFLKLISETKEHVRKKQICDVVLAQYRDLELLQVRFDLALLDRDIGEAIDLAGQILEKDPAQEGELEILRNHFAIPYFGRLTPSDAIGFLSELQTGSSPSRALVQMAKRSGDLARASAFLDLAEEVEPGKPVDKIVYNEQAKLAFAQGNKSKALELLARSLILDRKQPTIRKQFLEGLIGNPLLEAKIDPLFLEVTDAQVKILVTILLDSRELDSRERRSFVEPLVCMFIQFAKEATCAADAQKEYERAQSLDPKNVQVLEKLADLALEAGHPNVYREKLYQASQIDPKNKELREKFVGHVIKDDDLCVQVTALMDEMEGEEIRKVLASLHRNPPTRVTLADALLKMARDRMLENRIFFYSMANQLLPESADILLEWAGYAEESGGAGQKYRLQALSLSPQQPLLRKQMVQELYSSESAKVLQVFRDLQIQDQKDLWGQIHEKGKDILFPFLQERQKFVSALRLQPNSPEIRRALLSKLEEISELSEKMKLADAALAVVSFKELLNVRFFLALRRGNRTDALKFLFQSLEMDPAQVTELHQFLCQIRNKDEAAALLEPLKTLTLAEKKIFLPKLQTGGLVSSIFLHVGRRFPERLHAMEILAHLFKG